LHIAAAESRISRRDEQHVYPARATVPGGHRSTGLWNAGEDFVCADRPGGQPREALAMDSSRE